eukprot:348227_1
MVRPEVAGNCMNLGSGTNDKLWFIGRARDCSWSDRIAASWEDWRETSGEFVALKDWASGMRNGSGEVAGGILLVFWRGIGDDTGDGRFITEDSGANPCSILIR